MNTRSKFLACYLNEVVQEQQLDGEDLEADMQVIFQFIANDMAIILEQYTNEDGETDISMRGH